MSILDDSVNRMYPDDLSGTLGDILKKTIKITVEGAAHSGKSTIIKIIEDAIKAQGFENVQVYMLGSEPGVAYEALPVAVAKTRIQYVVIHEEQRDAPAKES